MARLSERDRRILLGDNYEELERQFLEGSRVPVTDSEKRANLGKRLEKMLDARLTAAALVVTGALMACGSYHRIAKLDLTGDIGLLILFGGVAFAVGLYFWRRVLLGRLERLS